jgi:hypothetical protein
MIEQEKPLSKKMSLGEWIIDFHRKKGRPLRFPEIVDGSVSYFGEHPDTNEKNRLISDYRKLIKDKKLEYDGTSYLPDK